MANCNAVIILRRAAAEDEHSRYELIDSARRGTVRREWPEIKYLNKSRHRHRSIRIYVYSYFLYRITV